MKKLVILLCFSIGIYLVMGVLSYQLQNNKVGIDTIVSFGEGYVQIEKFPDTYVLALHQDENIEYILDGVIAYRKKENYVYAWNESEYAIVDFNQNKIIKKCTYEGLSAEEKKSFLKKLNSIL